MRRIGMLLLTLGLWTTAAEAGSFCFQIPGTGRCVLVARDGSGTTRVVQTSQSAIEPQLGGPDAASPAAAATGGGTSPGTPGTVGGGHGK